MLERQLGELGSTPLFSKNRREYSGFAGDGLLTPLGYGLGTCGCVVICLRVNDGGTNHDCHTLTNLACTDLLISPDRMPNPDKSDLIYWSKSPAENSGRE